MKMRKYAEALSEFSHALSLNENLKVAFEKRAICYKKMSDLTKKKEKKVVFISKAEADEKKAKLLTVGDKT